MLRVVPPWSPSSSSSTTDAKAILNATPFSLPIHLDATGETHVWVRDRSLGKCRKWLVSVRRAVEKATVFIVLEDAAARPPQRVENRSTSQILLYRQVQCGYPSPEELRSADALGLGANGISSLLPMSQTVSSSARASPAAAAAAQQQLQNSSSSSSAAAVPQQHSGSKRP